MNRRDFLRRAGAGVGLLVLPRWAHGAAPSDESRQDPTAPRSVLESAAGVDSAAGGAYADGATRRHANGGGSWPAAAAMRSP
ncbi:twin-arginine translocation signal domain-containing protein [Planctomycetota bacterium]